MPSWAAILNSDLIQVAIESGFLPSNGRHKSPGDFSGIFCFLFGDNLFRKQAVVFQLICRPAVLPPQAGFAPGLAWLCLCNSLKIVDLFG